MTDERRTGAQRDSDVAPGERVVERPVYEEHRERGSNGVAIAALVLGLLSVPLIIVLIGPLLALIAIILGIVGVKKANSLGGTGKGMAITGIVSGLLTIVLTVLAVTAGISVFNNPAFQRELQQQQQQIEQEQGG